MAAPSPRLAALALLALVGGCGDARTQTARSEIDVEPASLDFGTTAPGREVARSLRVLNRGIGGLALEPLSIVGDGAAAFSVSAPATSSLGAGEFVDLALRFTPAAEGAHAARLLVPSNAANSRELVVSLTGVGSRTDPCGTVTCDQPPDDCHAATGTCQQGVCSYPLRPQGTSCDDQNACTSTDTCDLVGACLGAAKSCLSPPPTRCVGASQRSFGSGSCQSDGGCAYVAQDTPCPLGCDADAGACISSCGPGTHRCVDACVPDTSPQTCGQSCAPCPGAANASATCDAGACGIECNPGSALCGGACAACPGSDAGVASTQCAGSLCVAAACASGFQLCSGQCKATGPAACGAGCQVCAAPANAVAACDAGSCDFACNPGFVRFGGTCLSCDAGQCAFGCDGGAAQADGGCPACDVLVPVQYATVAAAIANAPSPGVVCIAPGTYTEDLALRPHVSLRGAGPATVIAGHLSVLGLAHPDPAPTVVSDLTLRSGGLAGINACAAGNPTCMAGMSVSSGTLALSLERLVFDAVPTGTVWFGLLDLGLVGASADLTVRDCKVTTERGFRVTPRFSGGGSFKLLAERNRFEPMPGAGNHVYDAFEVLPSCSTSPCAAGTTVQAVLRNNEVRESIYEAVYLSQGVSLVAADRAVSKIEVVNNTLLCSRATDYALWNNSVAGQDPRLIVANNLYYGCMAAPVRGVAPNVVATNLQPGTSPFVSLDGGNLHLVAGSSPIDAASAAYAPVDDGDRLPRPVDGNGIGTAEPDVGAYEYRP